MPYRLTAFQVNTWLQQKSSNSFTHKALGLKLHVIHQKDNDKSMSASSLPSYVLGGGMLPVPENDIPI